MSKYTVEVQFDKDEHSEDWFVSIFKKSADALRYFFDEGAHEENRNRKVRYVEQIAGRKHFYIEKIIPSPTSVLPAGFIAVRTGYTDRLLSPDLPAWKPRRRKKQAPKTLPSGTQRVESTPMCLKEAN
jgi:hypothetical protein